MIEWTVVTALATLAGLLAALLRPILSLHGAITRLTGSVENLEDQIADLVGRNSETHARLWKKCGEQDAVLQDHETRIQLIERAP